VDRTARGSAELLLAIPDLGSVRGAAVMLSKLDVAKADRTLGRLPGQRAPAIFALCDVPTNACDHPILSTGFGNVTCVAA